MMVFLEFRTNDMAQTKVYFVGTCVRSVLDETDEGKGFGSQRFISSRVITEVEARQLSLRFISEGMKAVRRGCKIYKLEPPLPPQSR